MQDGVVLLSEATQHFKIFFPVAQKTELEKIIQNNNFSSRRMYYFVIEWSNKFYQILGGQLMGERSKCV
jgi:hypothetical protein